MSETKVQSYLTLSVVISAVLILLVIIMVSLQLDNGNPLSFDNKYPTPNSEIHQVTDNISREWLFGVPCQPPCWEGITPGQTTRPEAIDLLKNSLKVTSITSATIIYDGVPQGEVYWTVNNSEIGGTIEFKGDADVIKGINIDPGEMITFQNVIDAYGEPSHVLAIATPCVLDSCVVYRFALIYMANGFALDFSGSFERKPEISYDWSDFHVIFFETNLDAFSVVWGNPAIVEDIIPWHGVQSFDNYCMGEHC